MADQIRSISLDDIGGLVKEPGRETEVARYPRSVMPNSQVSGGSLLGGDIPGAVDQTSNFGTSFTKLGEMFGRYEQPKRLKNAIAGALVLIALGILYWVSSGDQNASLSERITAIWGHVTGASPEEPAEEPVEAEPTPAPTIKSAVTNPVPAQVPAPAAAEISNPYWSLPNPMESSDDTPSLGAMSASQEEKWQQGLAHPFLWQRMKTVMDIRKARLRGSQLILNDALLQPKFWLRMEALLALAELNEAFDIETMEAALAQTRRALVQNYFRRFRQNASEGEFYFLRQAIRVVDAQSRLIILEALTRRRDSIHDLYLYAGSLDPSSKVKLWAKEQISRKPITQEIQDRFQRIASGAENQAPAAPVEAPQIQDLKAEPIPTEVDVDNVYFLKEEEKPIKQEEVPLDDGFDDLQK